MMQAEQIEAALLSKKFPTPLQAQIPALAGVLAEALNRRMSAETAQRRMDAEPMLRQLLVALAGQSLATDEFLLNFKHGAEDDSPQGPADSPRPSVTLPAGSGNIYIDGDVNDASVINTGFIIGGITIKMAPKPHIPSLEERKSAHALLRKMSGKAVPKIAPLRRGFYMPLLANPVFVGRRKALQTLAKIFKGSAKTRGRVIAAAVTGMGGLGKTQVAVEFVHSYGQYFAGGVFWLNFANPNMIELQVAACGGPGVMDLPGFSERSPKERVEMVRQVWNNDIPCLLVFDNCEDQELLKQWMPRSGLARVLVTSRRGDWDISLGVETLSLGVLDRQDSCNLLKQFRTDLFLDDPDLNNIACRLGDLPLALYLAGSFLRRYRYECSPAQYLEALQATRMLKHQSLREGGLSPTDHEQNVAGTIALSYKRLDPEDKQDALALALLPRISHFASGELIPRRLVGYSITFDEGEPRLRVADAIRRLVELGLVQENHLENMPDIRQAYFGGSLRQHQLISEFVRDVTDGETDAKARAGVEIALRYILSLPDRTCFNETLAPLQIHLQTVLRESFDRYYDHGEYDNAAALQIMMDRYLVQWGAHGEVFRNHQKVAGKLKESGLIIHSLINLGNAYADLGEFQKQADSHNKALGIAEQTGDERKQAEILGLIGGYCLATGEVHAAIEKFQRSLSVLRSLKDRHPGLEAKWIINLSNCYYSLGQIEQAIAFNEQALVCNREVTNQAIYREIELTCLLNHALCEYARGQVERAIEHGEIALGKAMDEGDRKAVAAALGNLGEYNAAMGYTEKARAHFEKALKTCQEFELKRQEGHILPSLAELLIDGQNYEQAIEMASAGAATGFKTGRLQILGENSAALARACLLQGNLSASLTAAMIARQHSAQLYKHYASLLTGLAMLKIGNRAEAVNVLEEACCQATVLAEAAPLNYRTWDVRFVASCALVACGLPDALDEARRCYNRARDITRSPGIIKRLLTLVAVAAEADGSGNVTAYLEEIKASCRS